LEAERVNMKKKSERSSDYALKVVILVWLCIIAGIFYHVYSTIQLGRRSQQALQSQRDGTGYAYPTSRTEL